MKKLLSILLVIMLVLSLSIGVYADEEDGEDVQEEQTEEQVQEQPKAPVVEEPKEVVEPIKVVVKAKVEEVLEHKTEDSKNYQKVKVVVTNSDYKNNEYDLEYNLNLDENGNITVKELKAGTKVLLELSIEQDGKITAKIIGLNRTGTIVFLIIVFGVSLCLISGKYGIKLLISLLITAIAIWFVLIKLIVIGFNSIIAAFLTSAIIIILTCVLFGGVHRKAFASAIGAIGGILVACIFTAIFSDAASLSGVREEAIDLSNRINNMAFNLRDIILVSSILASTGICLDISMHINNLLYNEKSKTEDMPLYDMFMNGISKGKDVIGSKSIILFLVYCASSVCLIAVFLAGSMHIVEIINDDVIAEQIIVSLCGTLGMLYTIPSCSLSFAFFNRRKIIYNVKATNKVEGKRSIKIK